MKERRFESRFLCSDLVQVDWFEQEDEFRTVEALLEDISPKGACVQVEQLIPPGLGITMTVGQNRFSGYVSHCVYRDYGYFVGIRFSEETLWSSGIFMPRHLTDLQSLAARAGLS